MSRDGVILVAVLCALGGFVTALLLAFGFSMLRRVPGGWTHEGQSFYASTEPAGGTAPPDDSENRENPR